MRTLKFALVAAVGSLALAGVARAEDAPAIKAAFNIGANTDYTFRGVSQSNEDPTVFGGVDVTIGKLGYAGFWASNVDFGPGNGTTAELDLYGGIKPTFGAVSLDIGGIYYAYPGQPKGSHEGYFEGKVLATVPVGKATLGASLYYSPEFFGKTGDAVYYEANASMPLGATKFSVSGAVGRQEVKGPSDYTTWNVGLGYAVNDHIGLDLRYWDTNEHKFGAIYDSRVIAGIKFTW